MSEKTPAAAVSRAAYATRKRVAVASVASVVVLLVAAIVGHHGPARPGGAHSSLSSDGSRPATPPAPQLVLDTAARSQVPGTLPAMPWPATGEAAVGVQGTGLVAASPQQGSVPIASVTKVMTAYIVLRDHPLAGTAGGPQLQMTEADALAYQHDSESGDSNLDVVAGEVLDERQLLEGLLIPSADNIADLLASWDAGSIPAFVDKMNAEAQVLGMTGTHYADASGLDPASRSTASDQVRLASAAMALPALASIVDNVSVRLPVSGEVWNYNPLVGTDGVVGVKSGFTSAASACLVAAAWRVVGGKRALLISVALGQPDGLAGAAAADRALLDAATPVLELRQVVAGGTAAAEVRVPWTSRTTAAVVSTTLAVVVWPGAELDVSLSQASGAGLWSSRDHGSAWFVPAAAEVGDLVVSFSGTVVVAAPLDLSAQLDGPPAGWAPSGH